MRILLLRLEGPLQSWGENAKWDERDTASAPGKSGVIGLIACAMGLGRGDPRIALMHRQLQVSSRADRPGLPCTDFHTVSSARMKTAGGKESERTIVSHRQYLQDASFLVAVTSDEDALLDEVAAAFRSPKWVPFLGRKACVPTKPLLEADTSEYADVLDAFCRHPLTERTDPEAEGILCEIDDPAGEHRRRDVLIDAAERRFAVRRTKYLTIGKVGADV